MKVTAEYPKRYSMVLCVFLFRPSETGTWTLGLCLLLCARWWLQSLQILTSTSWVSLHLVLYNNTFSRKIVLVSFGWCSFLSRNVQICVACSFGFVGHYHLVRFQTYWFQDNIIIIRRPIWRPHLFMLLLLTNSLSLHLVLNSFQLIDVCVCVCVCACVCNVGLVV